MFIKTGSALAALLAVASAQQVGTNDAETHPKITWQRCTASSCSNVNGEMVIDANWRWAHAVGGYTNCYDGNTWNATACPSQEACAKNCAIEGAKYQETYGVSTSGNAVTMKFSTKHQYGTNIGSRLYLMASATKYQMFTMNGNEIAFDVENSKLGCGLNGAVYFVSMDEDGGTAKYPTNKAGAKYGTGYCDSQCARDLKWIAGKGNVKGWNTGTDPNSGVGEMGACCAEMDLWEANSMSFALTPHPCKTSGYHVCNGSNCGGTYSEERYKGNCDPDGCDLNPFRHGNTEFYGPGKTVDTTRKFTVVTQFYGSGTRLDRLVQYFIQDGKRINVPGSQHVPDGQEITEQFCENAKNTFQDNRRFQELGGLRQMGDATGKGMVLVVSVWDDGYSHMKWLDGERFPLERDPSEPGVARGTCPTEGSEPETVRVTQKSAQVTYSNFKFGPVGSTYKIQ